MKILNTKLDGVLVVEPDIYGDSRGWFYETYNQKKYSDNGIQVDFIQDNHSLSEKKGVLRGIHFQNKPYDQSKLVRCVKGKIFDVAVDLRKSSPNYKKWVGVALSEDNKKQLFIPRGFGHAFLTLTENCEVEYKVDNVYSSLHDRSIKFDDEEINVDWPTKDVILSDKDLQAPYLKDSDVNF